MSQVSEVFFLKPKIQKLQKHGMANTSDCPLMTMAVPFGGTIKNGKDASTQWSPFKEDTTYFEPSKQPFMVNYRVENLNNLITDS